MKKTMGLFSALAMLFTSASAQDGGLKKELPLWTHNANIYEVNIRQYTPEGTFNAFAAHLDRLKSQGTDILWIMPINPIGEINRKGSLGSYYSVKDYTAVNSEFGTLSDFKSLVAEIHKRGMYVILDWVANHTARDNAWVTAHPDWYTHNDDGSIAVPAGTDWDDTADLNYDNSDMRKAMIEAMKFWLVNADIDGFRCDVAGMVPVDFWVEARTELQTVKPVFMLAEDESPKMHQAFDMTYGWFMHSTLNKVAKGELNCTVFQKLDKVEHKQFKTTDYRMNFTSNHDENSWNKSEYDRMGDGVKTFAVLTYMLPGMPLVYSGQEAANHKALKFFERDPLDFSNCPLQQFYTTLNQIKHNNSALWNGACGAPINFVSCNNRKAILAFSRCNVSNKVFCYFNLTPNEQKATINGRKYNFAPWQYIIEIDGKEVKIE